MSLLSAASARLRDDLRRLGPSDAVLWFARSIVISAACVFSAVYVVEWIQGKSTDAATLRSWAVAAMAGGAVFWRRPRHAAQLAPGRSQSGFVAIVMGLSIGVLLLVIPALLLIWRSSFDLNTGWRQYNVLNKRWLAALYGIAIVALVVVPPIWRRVMAVDSTTPTPPSPPPPAAPASRRNSAFAVVVVIALAWFAAGPPWHLDRHHRGIDHHEQVHLGPLQAIDKGYTPYVGPASTQYGPGSQLIQYFYMKTIGGFTVVGHRESLVAINFLAFITVGIVALRFVGLAGAVVVIALSMIASPLSFLHVAGDGSFGGMHGWSNSFRYLGTLIVVSSLALLSRRPEASARRWAPLVGVIWGTFAWVSQENLSSTLTGSTLLLALLWGSESIDTGRLRILARGLAVGFAIPVACVLAYYAAIGELASFMRNYFLISGAVAMGFSNSWWPEEITHPAYWGYRYSTILIVVLACATLCDLKTLTFRRRLTEQQVFLIAALSVFAASYQTALYRSDAVHFINTLLALPLIIVIAMRDVPAWVAGTFGGRAVVRLVLGAAFLVMFPLRPQLTQPWPWLVQPNYSRFTAAEPEFKAGMKVGLEPFRRATPRLSDEPYVIPGSAPMVVFLRDAASLRELVGERRTYIEGAGPYFTGLVYFMADLMPAPFLFDRETMLVNDALFAEHLAYFQAHIGEVDCVITKDRESPEARAFASAHPDAQSLTQRLGDVDLVVLRTP